jgi:hypothetical protein
MAINIIYILIFLFLLYLIVKSVTRGIDGKKQKIIILEETIIKQY